MTFKSRLLSSIVLFALLGLWISQSHGLSLNGIAPYKQLRKEFYLGALYLTEPQHNTQAILNDDNSQRMAIRVTTKRWSPRRWSLQWQNDIAINNPIAHHEQLTQQLMTFSGFLQGNLKQGDEIIIDYIHQRGTRVSINGVRIMSSEDKVLFNYLLNAWIGKLPPSGDFKNQLLAKGAVHNQWLQRYDAVHYSPERSAMIQQWLDNNQEKALKAKADLNELKRQHLAQLNAQAQQKAPAKAKKAVLKTSVKTKPPKVKATPIKKLAKLDSAHEKLEQNYYLALFQWQLKQEIRQHIQYPQWAKQFGQKGTVGYSFWINRQSEISQLRNLSPDVSRLLQQEVQGAIESVAPFVIPPSKLAGTSWPVEFYYVFSPGLSEQPKLAKPRMPQAMSREQTITAQQYHQDLASYHQRIRTIIADLVEYPSWSKKLGHKGKVEIEITINREGLVSASKEVSANRHGNLNQALHTAITAAQPLPSIPEQLRLNRTHLLISHQF